MIPPRGECAGRSGGGAISPDLKPGTGWRMVDLGAAHKILDTRVSPHSTGAGIRLNPA
jgi:hypothetical protein